MSEAIVLVTGVAGQGLVGTVNVWSVISDTQAANWQNVNDAQSPGWAQVGTTQSADWQQIAA
jgi:predicted ATP-grasp superfamily ATP-dependent carboligase